MKKQLLLAMMPLLVCIIAQAQQPETAQLVVHYKFTHIRDTTDPAHPYRENTALFVGKNAGAYKSYDGIVANAQFKKAYEEAAASSPDGRVAINRTPVGSFAEYYQFPNENKLLIKDRLLSNKYLIDGPMPSIDWKIGSDTASFGGLHCQKATAHFKGRDYTAWFCPDLPVHAGPWKLNGLPGVIVEAYDAKKQVVFQFDGIEKALPSPPKPPTADKDLPPILRGLNDDPNLIGAPEGLIKTSQKEFDKLQEIMRKDPDAFAQAIMAGQRANVLGDGPKQDGLMIRKSSGGPVMNNPIELLDNK